MSDHPRPGSPHRGWRRLYVAISVVLPRALREKHGAAMADLFVKELDRRSGGGMAAGTWTALVGMIDLVLRGLYERVMEERVALSGAHRPLLRLLAQAFCLSFGLLTSLMVGNYLHQHASRWSDQSVSLGTVFEALLLAIPFTVALTLPMAIFVAVLATASHVSHREEGPVSAPEPSPSIRLRPAPLLGLASLIALLAFAWNAEVVPRANARLVVLQTGMPTVAPSDRSMTLNALRAASRRATPPLGVAASPAQLETVAHYGIEIHKKPAIAAACVVLALLALGIAARVPRASVVVQVLASGLVFTVYHAIITTGESLAGQLLIPPAVAMWSANLLLLSVAVMLLRRQALRPYHSGLSAPRSP